MEVRFITDGGLERHEPSELPALLARDDGIVWVDVPQCDEQVSVVLLDVLKCHPLAVRDCFQRNRVARVHVYPQHLFVILHAPHLGAAGHVHYVELDQFVGERHLVTVHGPVNPAVPSEVPQQETGSVLARIEAGKFRPRSAQELSYAIVSALTRRQEAFVEQVTREVWRLEQRVTSGDRGGDPEAFLEELFQVRHSLLAVRTMSSAAVDVYGRVESLGRVRREPDRPLVRDLVDQFERVRSLADGEKDYLQGVIDFYRARTETKMTIAAERLTVIAVVTLPITAIGSVYGMNVIVNQQTHVGQLVAVLAAMTVISVILLTWAKRQGWW
ncbi:MAG: magnesium transporter CorA family protein [Mycobacteriales bacterium]